MLLHDESDEHKIDERLKYIVFIKRMQEIDEGKCTAGSKTASIYYRCSWRLRDSRHTRIMCVICCKLIAKASFINYVKRQSKEDSRACMR